LQLEVLVARRIRARLGRAARNATAAPAASTRPPKPRGRSCRCRGSTIRGTSQPRESETQESPGD
jgi:hypothetical protein